MHALSYDSTFYLQIGFKFPVTLPTTYRQTHNTPLQHRTATTVHLHTSSKPASGASSDAMLGINVTPL